MRDGFIECRHPGLPPEQTAFFKVPRNGWEPIEESADHSPDSGDAGDDGQPSAGESTNDSERNLS